MAPDIPPKASELPVGPLDESGYDEVEAAPPEEAEQPESNPSLPPSENPAQEEQKRRDQVLQEAERQKVDREKARVEAAKTKLLGKASTPSQNSLGQAKERAAQAEKRSVRQATKAAGQAAKKAAAQAAKAVGAVAKKAALALVANPYFWVIVGILVLLIIIIVVVISLFGFSRGTGKAPAQYPTTATQYYAATQLEALSGDKLANNKLLTQAINSSKERLQKIKSILPQAFSNDQAKISAASTELDAIMADMDKVLTLPAVEQRKKAIQDVSARLKAFNKNYPGLAGYGAVHGSYLPVPGVIEGRGGQCGHASVLMVILYYNPGFTDSNYYDPATHTTRNNSSCVRPDYLNHGTGLKDWTQVTSHKANLETVKKSLAGGDPVIIYTKDGSVFNGSPHIFVIVGYDPKDDTFIVNNPNVGHTEVHTKNPNNRSMKASRLSQYYGDSDGTYPHTFFIRGIYL